MAKQGEFTKIHIVPLVMFVETPLAVPGESRQTVRGVVRWATEKWNEGEYNKVRKMVDAFVMQSMVVSQGMNFEEFVDKLAQHLLPVLGDRDFGIAIGAIGIEYRAKKEGSHEDDKGV